MSMREATPKNIRQVRKGIRRALSNVRGNPDRKDTDIAAIVIGDVHLQKKPPKARSAEPDWFAAMKRPLDQIHEILERKECVDAEVLYVGDIVNHWDSSAELINFALENLPKGFSIAGQHDLPNHNIKDIKRSAYWTLVKAGHLEHLPSNLMISINQHISVQGFSWKEKLGLNDPPRDNVIYIALVHKYIWQSKYNAYRGAPKKNHVAKLAKKLEGFDIAYFGDNHIPFAGNGDNPMIVNCGSLMCRNTDQRNHEPMINFIHYDGSISWESLDTSEDKWLTMDELRKQLPSTIDLRGLTERLIKLGKKPKNFIDLLEKIIRSKEVGKSVKRIIRELIKELPE